jgi:nifR3 family TIM-barrel protein
MGVPSTTSDLLGDLAAGAGLAGRLVGFPSQGALGERLSSNPFLMAPMAGVSDAAYRLMARAGGATLAYTEMVSVAGIHYGGKKTWELVDPDAAEPDIAVQLFGRDPEQFREAAAKVADRLGPRLALLDVNMACPVPKVTRKGEGSALLDEPDLAADIIRACTDEVGVPVTAKIRLGRRPDAIVAAPFARALEEAGASAVAVHGRVASQLYRGQADRAGIADVVRAVGIPVIASGDVLTATDAVSMREETGCAAVFVARGTYGDPWIFSDALALSHGGRPPVHDARQRLAAFRLHVRLLEATHAHMVRARSLAAWYLKGVPNASSWRGRAMRCSTAAEFLMLADQVASEVSSIEPAGEARG